MDTRDPIEVRALLVLCGNNTRYYWLSMKNIFGSGKLATIDWPLLKEAAWPDHETVCDSHPFALFVPDKLQHDFIGRSFPRSF